jgi:hypothetical protein
MKRNPSIKIFFILTFFVERCGVGSSSGSRLSIKIAPQEIFNRSQHPQK